MRRAPGTKWATKTRRTSAATTKNYSVLHRNATSPTFAVTSQPNSANHVVNLTEVVRGDKVINQLSPTLSTPLPDACGLRLKKLRREFAQVAAPIDPRMAALTFPRDQHVSVLL